MDEMRSQVQTLAREVRELRAMVQNQRGDRGPVARGPAPERGGGSRDARPPGGERHGDRPHADQHREPARGPEASREPREGQPRPEGDRRPPGDARPTPPRGDAPQPPPR
jgi:hypothetical protein